MNEEMIVAAAAAISDALSRQLDDPQAQTITLTRDEALLALGLVEGITEHLKK